MDATTLLGGVRLMPVVSIERVEHAVPLARTLLKAGIGAIEVTLRSDDALAAIEQIARDVPEILLGAGSVRRPEQFSQVNDAGAMFAVSPGATEELLASVEMPYLPGAATASESIKLLEHGYRFQKFFPAEANGGVAAIKSLAGPLPEVRFCPTGGIQESNAREYLALDSVSCVGGSWFVPNGNLREGEFEAIEHACRKALRLLD